VFHQVGEKQLSLRIVWCQQAGCRFTAVKPVAALHFSLVLSFVQAKERTVSESQAILLKYVDRSFASSG
jgi:hypothetical protein